ncbi:sRNA-binding protein [Embleya sp. AB8]
MNVRTLKRVRRAHDPGFGSFATEYAYSIRVDAHRVGPGPDTEGDPCGHLNPFDEYYAGY